MPVLRVLVPGRLRVSRELAGFIQAIPGNPDRPLKFADVVAAVHADPDHADLRVEALAVQERLRGDLLCFCGDAAQLPRATA